MGGQDVQGFVLSTAPQETDAAGLMMPADAGILAGQGLSPGDSDSQDGREPQQGRGACRASRACPLLCAQHWTALGTAHKPLTPYGVAVGPACPIRPPASAGK